MIEVIDCEQGSESWFRARMGIPTASEFSTVMAKGKDGGSSVTRQTYLRKLAGEVLTGEPMEAYSNPYLERGKAMEAEARDFYAFTANANLTPVGFIKNGPKGCSPDSLVGDKGMLEIKTAAPHILIGIMKRDEFPPEHKAQCQGALWVADREWIDLCVYWPKLPRFVKRAYRDDVYLKTLSEAVDKFNGELAETVEFIRRYSSEAPNLLMAG